MNIGIIGSTGSVGKQIIKLLKKHHIPIKKLYTDTDTILNTKLDIVLLATPAHVSKQYAGILNADYIIDNSNQFRMEKDIPLIVPEINSYLIPKYTDNNTPILISNPNCSTAQLVMGVFPLHKKYTIKRMVISTYQSVSGSGKKGINQLNMEEKMEEHNSMTENTSPYIHKIHKNCIPCCDSMQQNGYTLEELKLINETTKILESNMSITATAVRIPVEGGHSESVNIEFENEFDVNEVKLLLQNTVGIQLMDYPTPLDVHGQEDVFIGRIRRDLSHPNTLNMWIVADNLMKGAALNAVQIVEFIYNNFYTKMQK
jgi:aspartate-semialdehyde dehydrogenase